MAAVSTSKPLCDTCVPKQIAAVTSCYGCNQRFCRKHFNEHRDKLLKDMQNVFNRHDSILSDLQMKIHRSSKPLENDDGQALLKQIDTWKTTTIENVSRAAAETRASVERFLSKTTENSALSQRIKVITKELKERQELENFVESDLDHWIKQLEQFKTDLDLLSTTRTDLVIRTQPIDWKTTIKVGSSCDLSTAPATSKLTAIQKIAPRIAPREKLASHLGSTFETKYKQLEEYSRHRTENASSEILAAINLVIEDTRTQQTSLYLELNNRAVAMEEQYRYTPQLYAEELESEKAVQYSALEKDLALREEIILDDARWRIDSLNEEANRLRIGVLRDAQARANVKIQSICDQVAALAREDAANK